MVRRPITLEGVVFEIGAGLEVRLLDEGGRCSRTSSMLVDAEGELHGMNCPGPAIPVCESLTLLFSSALLDVFSRVGCT